MKNDREIKIADAAKKGLTGKFLPYEKPRLESVRLFADQVLSNCGKLIVPPCSAPSEAGS